MLSRNTNRFIILGLTPLLATLGGCSSPTLDPANVNGQTSNTVASTVVPAGTGSTPVGGGTASVGNPAPGVTTGIPPVTTASNGPGTPIPTAANTGVVVPPGTVSGVVPPAPSTTDGTVVPPATSGPVTPPAPTVAPPAGRTCAVVEGLIADFEEGKQDVLALEGRAGKFEGYGDEAGTQTVAIVDEGADACNKGVLHASGQGFDSYVGVGATIAGTPTVVDGKDDWIPAAYDATGKGYTGISFRAKKGANQKTPVRFSLSTPWTEGAPYGDGNCEDTSDAETPCWNHLGHFLIDDENLTDQWQTYTFCFDRDLYPMFLPNGVSTENRRKVGANLLKIQFQFNQGFDASADPAEQYALDQAFDFYVDDVKLVKATCGGAVFQSTAGSSDAFGSNAKLGTCDAATDAALYNTAISQAYARWKAKFVKDDGGVVSPEQDNKITSEAISYGMMISAAMGDRATFDKIWGWASPKLSGGLLGWDNGGGGSATDADTDIAYALLMADKQWGGTYKGPAASMATAARTQDFAGDLLEGGSGFENVYNPSYFAPGFYPALEAAGGGNWGSAIAPNYAKLDTCDSSFTGKDGIVSDWCGGSGGAQVTSGVCTAGAECSAYDAARVPYRIGFDVCTHGGTGSEFIKRLVATFASKVTAGRIDLLKAGFDNTGKSTSTAVNNEMAFIGTVGVGAMGAGDAAIRDRAFRTTLDILERPEYYKTYYSTSLGLLTLLMMTGNWPTP